MRAVPLRFPVRYRAGYDRRLGAPTLVPLVKHKPVGSLSGGRGKSDEILAEMTRLFTKQPYISTEIFPPSSRVCPPGEKAIR